MTFSAGELDRQVRIERKLPSAGYDDAGEEAWELVEEGVWASVRDLLPARGDQIEGGMPTPVRSAKVRMYYRDDLATGMRLVHGTRIMTIVSGPAELGRRRGIELVVEDCLLARGAG